MKSSKMILPDFLLERYSNVELLDQLWEDIKNSPFTKAWAIARGVLYIFEELFFLANQKLNLFNSFNSIEHIQTTIEMTEYLKNQTEIEAVAPIAYGM